MELLIFALVFFLVGGGLIFIACRNIFGKPEIQEEDEILTGEIVESP
jgi:hypothetical protein